MSSSDIPCSSTQASSPHIAGEETPDLLVVNRTPVKAKASSTIPNEHPGVHVVLIEAEHNQLFAEMDDRCCEINIEVFMKNLVPGTDPTHKNSRRFKPFEAKELKSSKEIEMYPHICEVVQSVVGKSLAVKDTGHFDPSHKDIKLLPDIVIYPISKAAKDAYTLKPDDKANTAKDNTVKDKGKQVAAQQDDDSEESKTLTLKRKPFKASTSWDHMLLMFEVKSDSAKTPFGVKDLLPSGIERQRARSQLARYITTMLSHQHLLYAFQVVMYKSKARLILWDRAGVVVSEQFDVVGKHSPLHRFLFRFSKMTKFQRGADPTTSLASAKEVKRMRDYVQSLTLPKTIRERLAVATAPNRPIYKLKFLPEHYPEAVPESDRTERDFLVGNTDFPSSSPTGRATKGYIAYDVVAKRIVYLKDTWRPLDTRRIHPEKEVYERLAKYKVPYVAHLICGGDVEGKNEQKTITQNYHRRSGTRVHYRIVVEEVFCPLKDYRNSAHMIAIMECALIAHKLAWNSAKILHRDISASNIMFLDKLTPEGDIVTEGILNDWDLCRYEDEIDLAASQTGRTGSWQFMSGWSLKYPRKPHYLSDDLESFVHVIGWLALRFHKHTLSDKPKLLLHHVCSLYDFRETTQGVDIGGEDKYKNFMKGITPVDLIGNPALMGFLEDLTILCQRHYRAVDETALQKYCINPIINEETTDTPTEECDDEMQRAFMNQPRPRVLGRVSRSAPSTKAVKHVLKPSTFLPPPELVLNTHGALLDVLADAAEALHWPKRDKVPDQFIDFGASGKPKTVSKTNILPWISDIVDENTWSNEQVIEPGDQHTTGSQTISHSETREPQISQASGSGDKQLSGPRDKQPSRTETQHVFGEMSTRAGKEYKSSGNGSQRQLPEATTQRVTRSKSQRTITDDQQASSRVESNPSERQQVPGTSGSRDSSRQQKLTRRRGISGSGGSSPVSATKGKLSGNSGSSTSHRGKRIITRIEEENEG